MEVVRDGKAARQILLRSGTSLPAEEKFRFYTADRSGAVILRVYQNRFPIRTIHLAVNEGTDVGTPIDFNLSVDEAMTMVASGEVQGQTFWAQIEPPPEREMKEWEEIEELLERVDTITRELWGFEARHFKERTDPLVAGIRETVRTDPDKLQVLVARLEEAIEDYHERDTALTPGWGRYEVLLDAIKRVVFRGDGRLNLGLKLEEWRQRLEKLEEEASEAFNQHDQTRWSKAFGQIQAIWESLAQDEYRFTRNDPEKFAQQVEFAVRIKFEEVENQLSDFSYSANPETRTLQEARVNELRQELRAKVSNPLRQIDIERMGPGPARQELEKLRESLEYFERQIEKLPTIGLVRN
jgi:molecular chaperone DnaK